MTTEIFDWGKGVLVSKKYDENNTEICIYFDGNMYAAVSHSEDKCREFKNKTFLKEWLNKFNIH